MGDMGSYFLVAVFGTVFFLAYALVVPTVGNDGQSRRKLRKRIREAGRVAGQQGAQSLLRKKYLNELSGPERWLESLPGMEAFGRLLEQSGKTGPAYRVLVAAMILAATAAVATWIFTRQPPFAFAAGLAGIAAPFLKVLNDRRKRLAKFEEQLPDALDTMTRALKAGHPFSETLHLVGLEMPEPIAHEFTLTFNDLNYGSDPKTAMLGLLERVPSVNVMAMVTSVLIQRESGGNLAEILEKISALVRSRFRFQRRVRTLSAEGRLSAWILSLVPFGMGAAMYFVNPDYLGMLLDDSQGRRLILLSLGMMCIGLLWIRQIIRIRV